MEQEVKVGDYIMWDRCYSNGINIPETRWEGGYGPHRIISIEDFEASYEHDGCTSYVDIDGGGYTIVPPPEPDDVKSITLDDLAEMVGIDLSDDTPLEQHPTGALRESKEGKGKPHLLLCGFPRALMALSRHVDCELGRARNWEQGLPESSLIDSQFRHLMGYTSGNSEDTPEYNLTANLWNSIVLLEEYLRVQDGVMEAEVLDVGKESNYDINE